ncbi:hypothetical protein DPMN_137008, partial [Dreissena polymorpha]
MDRLKTEEFRLRSVSEPKRPSAVLLERVAQRKARSSPKQLHHASALLDLPLNRNGVCKEKRKEWDFLNIRRFWHKHNPRTFMKKQKTKDEKYDRADMKSGVSVPQLYVIAADPPTLALNNYRDRSM